MRRELSALQLQNHRPNVLQNAIVDEDLFSLDSRGKLVLPVFHVLGLLVLELSFDQPDEKGINRDKSLLTYHDLDEVPQENFRA